MKTNKHIQSAIFFLSIALLGFSSCQKEALTADQELEFAKLEAVTISSTSAIAGSGNSIDSLYAMEACKKGNKKTAIEFNSLPSAITVYLTTNYTGYTALKSFQITNKVSAVLESFVVLIQFNSKPVALKFDAAGNFVKVLEIREGRNMKGRGGWHAGGCFDNRDGKHRDTIALSSLPALVKVYFTATNPGDTLMHAVVNKDKSIVVISKNVNYFATVFSSSNVLVKRIQLPSFPAKGRSIEASAIPGSATTYLSTTYPNYVFMKAFEIKSNGVVKAYLVVIDASLTKYAIHFDATGNFVSSVTIR
jgi:hypothetical protein